MKLDVWILSMKLVREVYTLTHLYPNEERYALTSQTNRAAIAIPSNIAEGLGRNFKKIPFNFYKFQVDPLMKLKLF